MRFPQIAILALAALAACGDSNEPEGLTAGRINGEWSFTLTRATNCSGGQGTVYAVLDMQGNDDTGNTVSTWTNDPAVPDRFDLIGNIRFRTGQTELRFWTQVLSTGFLVTGTIRNDLTFTGTGVDPIPGYRPYLSLGVCTYNVTGRKL